MFFDLPNNSDYQQIPSIKNLHFVVQDIECLFVTSEDILKTHFFELFSRVMQAEYENDGLICIDLIQDSDEFSSFVASLFPD